MEFKLGKGSAPQKQEEAAPSYRVPIQLPGALNPCQASPPQRASLAGLEWRADSARTPRPLSPSVLQRQVDQPHHTKASAVRKPGRLAKPAQNAAQQLSSPRQKPMASLEPPVWPLGPLMGYGTLAKLSPNKRSRPGLSPAYTFAAAPFVQDPLGGTNGRVCRAGDALRAIEADGVASNGLWAAGQVFHSFHREVKQAAFEKEEARVRLAAAEAAASVAKDSARRASELTEELTAAHQVSEARREQLVSLKSQVEEQEAAAKRCEALNLRLEELQREVGTADMEAEKLTSQLSDALKEKAVAAAELDDLKGRLAELMKAQAASDIEREELVGRLEAQRLQVDALNEKRAELGEARNQLAVMEQRLDAACTEACVLAEKVEEAAREREIARSVCVILREQVESLESRNAEACRQLDDLHQSMDSAVLERDVLAKECSSLQDKLSASEALAKDAIVAEEGAREELAEALRGLGAAERRVEGLKKAVRQQKEACKEAAERANAADREKEERALGIRALEAQLAEATAEGEERAREELRKAEASEAFAKKAERAMEVARRELEELKEERGAAEVEMQEAKATTMRLQAAVAQHQAESSCAQNKLAEVCLAKEGLEARMLQLEKELKDAQAQTTALEAAEMASREELSALHRRLETSEVAARKALEALREIESALSVAVEGKEGAERKISALEALVAEGEKAAAEATMRLEGMEKALREAEAAAACHIERLRVAEVEGADSEARVNALEAELGSLGEALHASEAAALAALASAEAVKAECLAAEGIRRAAEERAEELQASVARHAAEAREALASLAALESLHGELEIRANGLENQLAEAKEEKLETTQRLMALKADFDNLKRRTGASELAALKAAEAASGLEQKLQEAHGAREAAEVLVENLRHNVAELEGEEERHKIAIKESEERIADLSARQGQLTAQAEELEAKVKAADMGRGRAEAELSKVEQQLNILQEEAAASAVGKAEAEAAADEAGRKLKVSCEARDAAEERLRILEDCSGRQEAEAAEAAEAARRARQLESEAEGLREELEGARAKREKYEERLMMLKEECGALSDANEVLKAEKEMALVAINAHKEARRSAEAERDEARMRLAEASEALNSVGTELAVAQEAAKAEALGRMEAKEEAEASRARLKEVEEARDAEAAKAEARAEAQRAAEAAAGQATAARALAEKAAGQAEETARDERDRRQKVDVLLAECRDELEATTLELLKARGVSSTLKAQLEESARELEAALECHSILQSEVISLGESSGELRLRCDVAEAKLFAVEAKKASEHSEALKSARLELNNVKERNHLENAEREAEMAGLAKELECVRENREVVMAEKAALETRLRASERKVLALEAEQQELLRRAQEMEEGLQQAVGRSRDLAETLDKARREKEAETLYGFEPLREALAEASEARDKALARCASLAEAVSKAKQEAVKAANERDALASEVKRLRTQEKSSMHSLSKQTPSPAKQHPDRYMLSVSPSRGSDSPVDGLRSGKNGGAVAWKTNWMPEALPVDMGGDAAGRLAHAAADITSALANELGALRASALPGTALIEGQGAQQVASAAAEANKTPPTPRMGPGWVEEQRMRFERIARPLDTPSALDEPVEGGADDARGPQLHSLTLLMWQLQSDASSLKSPLASPRGAGAQQGEGSTQRKASKPVDRLKDQLEEAAGEVERVLEERSKALDDAQALARQVRALERDKQEAMKRIEDAGAMWGQAQELAQRTVQELAAASERISWLEGELAATREAAQGRGKPSLAQERGRAPLLYSGNAQVAALKQARERLEAAGDPGKIPEAVGILKGVTAELGALVMSTKPPEAEARAPRWADERCSFRQGGATPALSDKMASAHTSLNKQPPCGAKTSKASASGTGKPKATMKAAPPAVSKAKTTSGWRL